MAPALHILHVFSSFAPGGAEVRAVSIMNSLGVRARHSIVSIDGIYTAADLISPEVRFELLPFPQRGRFRPLKGLPGGGLISAAGNIAEETWRLRGLIRSLRPELVLTYGPGAAGCLIALRTMPRSGYCALHAEDGFQSGARSPLTISRLWLRRIAVPGAIRTVVPSRTLETFILSNFGLPADRVVFIPNGVDIDRFRPLYGSEMRKRLGIREDEIVFGIVANLRREKRLDVLFRGLHQAKLKSWRLLVAGDGPCRPDLLSLASELQISHQLLWAGPVKDTVPYYAAMDVFVLSSETEQMPVSLLEAMACGKAVIVTDVGDCRSVLAADGPPVVVPPNDPGSMADALRGMHASAELRAELGLRNRSRCVEHFSHERMMSRYIELYEWASGRKF